MSFRLFLLVVCHSGIAIKPYFPCSNSCIKIDLRLRAACLFQFSLQRSAWIEAFSTPSTAFRYNIKSHRENKRHNSKLEKNKQERMLPDHKGHPLNSLKNLLNMSSSYPIIQCEDKFAPISTVPPPPLIPPETEHTHTYICTQCSLHKFPRHSFETDSGRVSNDFSHDLIWFVKG